MDSYSVFSDMNFSMETEILEVDLRNFTATDFYNKKILISPRSPRLLCEFDLIIF